jgi:heterodisulfide reductase subunit A
LSVVTTWAARPINLYKTISGDRFSEKLADIIADVETPTISQVHLEHRADRSGRVCGQLHIRTDQTETRRDEHGVAVIATGGSPFQPTEYEYGKDPRIMTSLELDKKFMADDPNWQQPKQRCLFSVSVRGSRTDRIAPGSAVPIPSTAPSS